MISLQIKYQLFQLVPVIPDGFNSPARVDVDLFQNIRHNLIGNFLYLLILSKGRNKTVPQATVRVHILQRGLQLGDLDSGIVPLFCGGGFCGEIFRLADLAQCKGFIEAADLLGKPLVFLPQSREFFPRGGNILFPALALFLP